MGLVSRSLKLLRPRLLEEPPLSEGPGPSLPGRSVRMRIGPLFNPTLQIQNKTKKLLSIHGENKTKINMQPIMLLIRLHYFIPQVSFVGVYAAIILPSMPSIPGWTVMRHARHCSSGSHRAIMNGHRPPLISVSAVCVTEFGAGRRRWLSSADRFKVLGVTLKARALSVRSRATLLCLWLTIKPVTS